MLGADKDNALFLQTAGKGFVLTQKTIAGVHGLCAGLLAGGNDAVGLQIGLTAGRWANVHGFIGQLDVAGFLVRFGVDRNSLDAHFLGGGDDSACDLATVGDQDFCKHDVSFLYLL